MTINNPTDYFPAFKSSKGSLSVPMPAGIYVSFPRWETPKHNAHQQPDLPRRARLHVKPQKQLQPEVLPDHRAPAWEVDGPVILQRNLISVDCVLDLIPSSSKEGWWASARVSVEADYKKWLEMDIVVHRNSFIAQRLQLQGTTLNLILIWLRVFNSLWLS